MKLRNYESLKLQTHILFLSLIFKLIQMLRIHPEGFFRFWMIFRSPYSWFKIISTGWAFFHHKPLYSFLLFYFFLVLCIVFLCLFSILFAFISSLFFFIISAFILHPIKKSGFPLFLYVLLQSFKVFRLQELNFVIFFSSKLGSFLFVFLTLNLFSFLFGQREFIDICR